MLFRSLNLAGIPVAWNDAGNENWQEQFAIVLNAAFVDSQVIGKPGQTATIAGVRTEEYSVNLLPNVIPTFKYQSNIEGTVMNFEIVSATSAGESYLYERAPNPSRIFNREQLMSAMYQDHRVVSDRTIDSHIKKIRRKMAAICPDQEFIHALYGVGYKFEIN